MAKARKVTVQQPQEGIELTMTKPEAQTLLQVLGKISGYDKAGGERDNTSSIYKALTDAGLEFNWDYRKIDGSLTVVNR